MMMLLLLVIIVSLVATTNAASLSWTNGNWTNGLIMGRAYLLEWTSDGIAATTPVTIRCYKSTPTKGRRFDSHSLTDRTNAVA